MFDKLKQRFQNLTVDTSKRLMDEAEAAGLPDAMVMALARANPKIRLEQIAPTIEAAQSIRDMCFAAFSGAHEPSIARAVRFVESKASVKLVSAALINEKAAADEVLGDIVTALPANTSDQHRVEIARRLNPESVYANLNKRSDTAPTTPEQSARRNIPTP